MAQEITEELELLKREEIRTMAKDIAKLRELATQEERERIAGFKPKPEEIGVEAPKVSEKAEERIEEKEAPEKPAREIPTEITEIKISKEETEELKERKNQLEKELSLLPEQRKPLEQQKKQFLVEIDEIKKIKLEPVLKIERDIEDEKEIIEEEERKSPPERRRLFEEKRWKTEEKRKGIEEQKWQIEEEIEKTQKNIIQIDYDFSESKKKEEALKKEIEEMDEKEKIIKLKEEALKLTDEVAIVSQEREETESNFQETSENKEQIERTLNEILESEQAIEEEIKIIEEKEKAAQTQSERREIEKKRWKTEEERKKTEMEKWKEQEEKNKIEVLFKEVASKVQNIKEKERKLKDKLAQIKVFLETKGVKHIEEIEAEPKIAEITEKEKIPEFKTEEEVKKEEIPEETEEKIFLRELPPKQSSLEKFLTRLTIILISVFISGFFYWFFVLKPKTSVPPAVPPNGSTPAPQPEIPLIVPPASLISVEKTLTIEVSENEEIKAIIQRTIEQLSKEGTTEGVFSRLLFKNISQNKFISLKDISRALQIEVPEELFQKLEENYTLAVYSQKQGKRLALVSKIKEKERLDELLNNWESKINKDGLFIIGEKIPALLPYFRTALEQKTSFRYLSLSKEDSGVCYTWRFDDYFVVTTSFESMKKMLAKLKTELSPALKEKAGQMAIVGFEGKEITPQLEEFLKDYKPGGVLLLSQNIESKEQLKGLTSDLQEISLRETGQPLLIAVDQEGGIISRLGFLEEKTPQSEIKNREEAERIGLKRGEELKDLGINLNLAPVLDWTKEGDFLFERSFKKNPETSGDLGGGLISGQKAAGIFTGLKHFPGYCGITSDPEEKLATLESIPEISQFKKAMESEPEFAITSNVIYKEIDSSLPFTFSLKGIKFLKDNLGTKILLISDDLDQNSLLKKYSLKEIMTKPIQAGVDILIFSDYRTPVKEGLDAFMEAIKNKEITEARINESYSRIIELKKKLLK